MATSKISIVLPSYNGSKYIRESINSVLSQTFIDWELIIVNDCSTDNTLDIAKEYAAKDNRITVINNEVNQKLPASLNIGFRQAKGDYLTWTSDDNLYKSDAIKEMYEFLVQNPGYKMVCCDMDIIDSEGNLGEVRKPFNPVQMRYNNCVGACFMYHREVLKTVGEYTIGKFCVEDYDYWLRIMRQYGDIGYLNKNLYMYRVHGGSLTFTKRTLIREQLIKLWYENLEWHVDGLIDRKDLLWKMYYAFYSVQTETNLGKVLSVMSRYIPVDQLSHNFVVENVKFAIYGAGVYGKICRKILGDRAVCFIDNNKELQGKTVEGLQVFNGSQLDYISRDCSILIAVAPEKVWEIYTTIGSEYKYRIAICHEVLGREIFDVN